MRNKKGDLVKPLRGAKNKHGIAYIKCHKCNAYVAQEFMTEHQCEGLMSILYGAYLQVKDKK